MCNKEEREYVKIKGKRHYVIHTRKKPYSRARKGYKHHSRSNKTLRPMSLREFSHLPEHYDSL